MRKINHLPGRAITILFISAACLFLLLYSCKKETIVSRDEKAAFNERQKIILQKARQTTYIVSEVMKDDDIRVQVLQAIQQRANQVNSEEALSLKELFDISSASPFPKLAKAFSEKFMEVYQSGNYLFANEFPKPAASIIKPGGTSPTVSADDPDVLNFSDGRQIYFPYSQDFPINTIKKLSFSYYPVTQEDYNSGYLFNVSDAGTVIKNIPCTGTKGIAATYCSGSYTFVPYIDDGYAQTHPTIIINFEATPTQIQPFPPPVDTCAVLTYNTRSSSLTQDYIVNTTIPHWRLNKNYRGLFGGASVILLYRISTSLGTLSTNPYGYFNPSIDGPYLLLGERKVKRHDVNHHVWQNDAITWDLDWDLHENQQKILFVSKQGFLSNPPDLTEDVKITAGLDSAGRITANGTIELITKIDFHKTYIERYYSTLDRSGIFTTVVGDLGPGTAKREGLESYDFPLREADAFEYYFKHRICF